MTEMERTDGRATSWLALSLVRGLAPREAIALVARCGGIDGLRGADDAALAAAGLSPAETHAIRTAVARASGESARIAACQARVIGFDDPAYPERLRHIADPPLALVVRGSLRDFDRPMVAIVGARRGSPYGRAIAERLGRGLGAAGVTVVSGLAIGVDGAAHRGALDGGGSTIAVLAHGIDHVHPAWHRPLAREVVEQGLLVTEFVCGTPALKPHFPRRNRIVSGLVAAVVVVEAAERSGSLVTARLAGEQGRDVLVVPGPVDHPGFAGSHRLIREGATLVADVDHVLEVVAPALATGGAVAAPAISDDDAKVLTAIDETGGQLDAILRSTGLAPATAHERLLALELRGLVIQRPGMQYGRGVLGER